ncbi:MAG TPA: hypothetical protein DDW78_10430 [Treponema sp.]|nr:hypothetical protein [Treponema sp.]
MELIDNVKDSIQNFIEENSKLTAAIIAIFLLLIVSGTAVLLLRGKTGTGGRSVRLPPETFTETEEFLKPEQVNLTEDYYFSRISPDNWSDAERERWFTPPDEQNMQELGKANDKIIDTILEAAP